MWLTFPPKGVCIGTVLQSITLVGICASQCWFMAHARSGLSSCSPTILSKGV